jgi:D-alanine-D-alanine ligase
MNIEPPLEARLIAVTYNLKRTAHDQEAEFDSPQTIDAISTAIRALGHDVIMLEANEKLPARLAQGDVDLVFNIAEGYAGHNREAHVPALLEMLAIPYTGSDSKALTVTLDKALAKKVVAAAGILTPKSVIFNSPTQEPSNKLSFPLIIKPLSEGSSKGISSSSVVHNTPELQHAVKNILFRYDQPALVEQYVGGREFTVGVLENSTLEVLPPMEIIYLCDEPCPIYSYAYKLNWQAFLRYETKPHLNKALKTRLENYALRAFKALGCRDVARFDFRMDHKGQLYFLECNALPGLAPDWSDLCLISTAAGISHQELIQRILTPALKRLAT